jgi:hypothetical protein
LTKEQITLLLLSFPLALSTFALWICIELSMSFPMDFTIQSLTKFFLISFAFIEVNCLYFMKYSYVERDFVILNSLTLLILFISMAGNFQYLF